MKKALIIALTLAIPAIQACTPSKHVRGNIVEDFRLAEVQPGVDTQSDIIRKLGSPTTKAPFDDKVWYYIGQETSKKGILDPEVESERIVIVSFDDTGVVSKVDNVDPKRMDIPYVREKTPTSGNEVTVMQQLLGNLGRFNKEEGKEE